MLEHVSRLEDGDHEQPATSQLLLDCIDPTGAQHRAFVPAASDRDTKRIKSRRSCVVGANGGKVGGVGSVVSGEVHTREILEKCHRRCCPTHVTRSKAR